MKRILQLTAVAALTVFFLWLFLRNANLSQVGAILRRASLGWVVIGFAVNFGALLLRTARWRTILDPDHPPPFFATLFANTVGYMLSIVLPIRAADFARPALLARRTNHRFSGALGTVLTERVLDLASILTMFVIFAVLRWNEFSHDPAVARWFYIVRAGAIASALILVALICFIIGLYFFRERVRRMHEWLGRFVPKRFRESWMHFFDTFTETLAIARHPSALLKVLFCTVGVWICLTSQFWFATKAVAHPLPFDSSFFVTGVTTVGLAIPTPGGVGGFHKACQLVLTRFYGFDVDSSVAVAVLFHIIGTLPVLCFGLFLFATSGIRLKEMRGEVRAEESAEE
ncbi:MAG TPA: lysylphosphatidylglycerol synthase transmembrane domain-containing protein [Thermoanaerobaculia bacterium]|nr:lysylphosphatidylglycerol synthase transmembrane domain-containing protein [Thermoanaerobaculia bacterium]